MAEKTTVLYDQLEAIVKKFHNEGEGIAQLNARLREKVHAMHNEWMGAGSEAFFDEMEMEILPAVKRLSEAMLLSGKTLTDITRLYRHAEEESSNIFKGDFTNISLGDADFGAGKFNDIGNLTGAPGGPDLTQTDYGASQFANLGGEAGGASSGSGNPPGEVDLGTTDYGASQFDQGSGSPGESVGDQASGSNDQSTGSAGGGSGGSDGGGASGAGGGASGDLNEMGAGLKQESMGSSSSGGGGGSSGSGATPMQDHIYQSSAGASAGGSGSGGPSGPASSPSAPDGESAGNAAAGVAGMAGGAAAAMGGAAKVIKDKKEEE